MNQPKFNPVVYVTVRDEIRNGDLLLWRPTSRPHSRFIAAKSGGRYSHLGMAAWALGVLTCQEMLQWHGGRGVTLSSQVRAYPGLCDVYRVPMLHGRIAAQAMIRRTGMPYGWRDMAWIARRRLCSWLPPMDDSDITDDTPLVCTGAGGFACAAGGRRPRPDKSLHELDPGDFVADGFSVYQFTLFASYPQIAFAEEHLLEEEVQ
jgi:hypothetical protein